MLHFSINKQTATDLVTDINKFKDSEKGLEISGSLELLHVSCQKALNKEKFVDLNFNNAELLQDIITSLKHIEDIFNFEFSSGTQNLILMIEMEFLHDFAADEDYDLFL